MKSPHCSCSQLLVPLLLFMLGHAALAAPSLNEIVSSNGNTIADEDGAYADWIELRNTGSVQVNLSGWGLSDAPTSPFKWIFPQNTTLGAGGHLLIWASGKNRTNPLAPLHTNFSISASGETIVLTQPNGTTADSVAVPALPRNISYGRKPDAGTAWFYFDQPTPGSANTTAGYVDLPPIPTFSIGGGFFTSPLNLQLSTAPGWTVYYTLDGSDPDPSRVSPNQQPYRQSMAYTAPITVSSRAGQPNVFSMIPTTKFVRDWLPEWSAPDGEVFKATVVRAAAYETATGRLGRTVTQTYFVDPNIMTRYAGMPVVSLVSDYVNLFHDASGIYVPGSASTTEAEQNFMQGWTRTASIEFFETGGVPAFSDIFDINIQGASSRTSMQKGLHVATGDDSQNNLINYPLFAARGSSASATTQFKRFILRGWGSTRKWPVLFTDAHHQTLAAHSGLDIQDYRPVVVFINGEYWGLHELREANKNSWYHQFRTSINRDNPGYDLLDEGGDVVDEGDAIHWNALWDYIDTHNVANDAVYNYIATQVDVENLARYISHCIISGKRDWPQQNESLWRPRTPDGRWRWTQYDMDHGLVDWSKPSHNMVLQSVDGISGYGPHPLFRKLLTNDKFERLFVNTCLDWLNSYFLTEVELDHFDALKAELDPFISEFNNRWPILTDSYYKGWQGGTDYGRGLVEDRRYYRRSQLINYFNLGTGRSLTLDADPAMGVIRCNSLVVDETLPGTDPVSPYPWERSYYQNYPVELEALPKESHRFLGWIVKQDGVNLAPLPEGDAIYYSKSAVINVAMNGTMTAEAVFEPVTYLGLHVWNYQNASVSLPSYTIGGGLLTSTPVPGGNIYLNAAAQDFTSTHLRVDLPIGAQLQWSLPTTGHQWPRMSFLTRRSGQGAGTQHLSYTLDGTNWTLLKSYAVADAAPQLMTFDFSGISGSGNNPDFAVRLTFSQGSGGTGGNNRFDDVVLAVASLPDYPIITAPLVNRELVAGGSTVMMDLADYFEDSTGGTPALQVQSVPSGVASTDLNGSLLELAGLSAGETLVTVSALFNGQAAIAQSFRVLVYPAPYPVAGGVYHFSGWSSEAPAGSFPPHMIFLQSETSDPVLDTPLQRAYAIPSGDAAVPADVDFPYAALSRTRINGRGSHGISFINTGRGRDVGSALLAIDTTGQHDIQLKWTAGTVAVNNRIYALSLQYRIDPANDWITVTKNGSPVQYVRNELAGHEQVFGPITLPAELENQPYVQLQWRYHHVSGNMDSRAEIRLDDIVLGLADSYESWAALAFSESEVEDPALSDPLADYAGDGTPNLIKYALGLQPGEAVTPDRLLMGVKGDGRLFARFHLDRSLSDITYRLEASPDLNDWNEMVYDSGLDPGPNSNGHLHEVVLPLDSAARKFLRLRVER
jgi:hypothetical protein